MGRALEVKGDFAHARPYLEELSRSGEAPYIAALARLEARSGNREVAAKLREQLLALSEKTTVNPYDVAAVYAAERDPDNAMKWLDRAFEQHIARLAFMNVEPMFVELRADPRFHALASKVGLR
jgi:tetratricopeptide (TPR) repeat protein